MLRSEQQQCLGCTLLRGDTRIVQSPTVMSTALQSPTYRGLVSLGIGSVGGAAVTGCKPADSTRLGVIVTGMRGGVLLTEELLANGLPIDGISGSLVAGVPSSNPLAIPADPVSSRFAAS